MLHFDFGPLMKLSNQLWYEFLKYNSLPIGFAETEVISFCAESFTYSEFDFNGLLMKAKIVGSRERIQIYFPKYLLRRLVSFHNNHDWPLSVSEVLSGQLYMKVFLEEVEESFGISLEDEYFRLVAGDLYNQAEYEDGVVLRMRLSWFENLGDGIFNNVEKDIPFIYLPGELANKVSDVSVEPDETVEKEV